MKPVHAIGRNRPMNELLFCMLRAGKIKRQKGTRFLLKKTDDIIVLCKICSFYLKYAMINLE